MKFVIAVNLPDATDPSEVLDKAIELSGDQEASVGLVDASLLDSVQAAADAAAGDSNDAEIEALRDALDATLGYLNLTLPEPTEED